MKPTVDLSKHRVTARARASHLPHSYRRPRGREQRTPAQAATQKRHSRQRGETCQGQPTIAPESYTATA